MINLFKDCQAMQGRRPAGVQTLSEIYHFLIACINSWPCGPSSASDLNDSKPEDAVNIYIYYITGNIFKKRIQSVRSCSGVVSSKEQRRC